MFLVLALFGYSIMLVVGVPLYCIFQKLGWSSLFVYMTSALVIASALIYLLIILPGLAVEGSQPIDWLSVSRIGQFAYIVTGCCFVTLVFWFIARPDKKDSL